ncbi:hypothetical protein CY35_11G003000 [Sphagnum magellanicum]|nr:hypothetical protein CY35_11G003000 [Sphagnum magellanicum]
MAAVLRFSPSPSLVSDSSGDGNVVVSCSSSSLVSSLAGEKLRLRTTSVVGSCACGNRTTTVRSAAGRGFQAEKLREVRALSSLFPSSDDQRAEVSAGAVATTDYGIARGRGGRQFPFGYSQGSDSEEEEEEEDEEAEVLLVDKNVKDPGSQLDIASLGLPQPVVDALAKRGISQLFPIQRAVLEPALQGRDLIARAKTGTGKTLAFGIPVIQHIVNENERDRIARAEPFFSLVHSVEENKRNAIARRVGRAPRALVLAPTRELAKQVEREFMESAPMLSTICVYGGVPISTQQRQLQRGVDIAVGTPGRIIDLIDRGSLQLQNVCFLVLDEADQMLAVGFEEDVERILETMTHQRQTMLFSATMPPWVKKLSRKYLKNALTIDLVGETDEKLAEGIKLYAVSTVPAAKRSVLNDLIAVYGKGGKSIVFTQTKRDADDVALAMGRFVGCEALHGDITQSQREKTLNAFREGNFSVLVATDVAARGLDIPNVDLVIHYEIPNDPETFVHRSGRTGRAGKEGTAILMFTDRQLRTMRLIERDVGCKFERVGPPNAEDVMHASSEQATEVIRRVHPQLTEVFMPTAELLLAQQGPSALAAALAHLSGFSQPPSARSLITHEEGWTTLKWLRTAPSRPVSARMLMGALADIWQTAADKVGKIRVIDDRQMAGAVFDLPSDVAKELLSKLVPPGDSIDIAKKLPRLEEEEVRGRSGDMYGRFSPRGGGRSSGGGRGSFDRSDRGSNRGGDRFGDRSSSRSSNPESWRQGSSSSGSSRLFGDNDWSGRSSGRSDRNFGRGDRATFSGTCFICNQAGHRAADCPSRQ